MRCLVTGASGHLGDCVVRLLLAQGHMVAGLVRKESDLWRIVDKLSQISLFHVELSDTPSLKNALTVFRPEVVFHLAWSGVTAAERDNTAQVDVNLSGTLQLATLAAEAGCRCWVGLGSQAEYGPQKTIITEDTPTWPITNYGAAKLAACHLTHQICRQHEMRFVWVRLLAAYGPKDDPRHLIPSVITQLLQQQTPALTMGNQHWDYLYSADAAEAICGLANDLRAQGVFVLGSGQAYRVRDIAEMIRDMIDPGAALGLGQIPESAGPVHNLCANISRLRATIGWTPKIDLRTGIQQTVAWYRNQRSGLSVQIPTS